MPRTIPPFGRRTASLICRLGVPGSSSPAVNAPLPIGETPEPAEPPEYASRFVAELPADPEADNRTRQVFGACYSLVRPAPVRAPVLLAHSREVATDLGLSAETVRTARFAEVFGGNALEPGMQPYAACYAGHQFGRFAGQLGDGRAITLGERKDRGGVWQELQLKGAGPTPYSRHADGRAVLRSSVREFLCSEAMHHLGVPTTRALCLVGTGEHVERDMFYDGHPKLEPGAIVCRVAPSFLRFGNFEIFAARGDEATLAKLAGFALEHYFPEVVREVHGADTLLRGAELATPDAVARMFEEVARRTARMVVEWMRVGFVHGVMNTDNMSMLGLTIDYGPYGFLEDFDPNWTPNTTDAGGRRYRYGHQPLVAGWNVSRLAGALHPLVRDEAALRRGIEIYDEELAQSERAMMARKLGLRELRAPGAKDADPETVVRAKADRRLVLELFDALQLFEIDMTLFYRALARVPIEEDVLGLDAERLVGFVSGAFYAPSVLGDVEQRGKLEQLGQWLRAYVERSLEERRAGTTPEERRARMNRANPKYLLRNYLAQLAIDRAEAGDPSEIEALLDVLRYPYDEQPGLERYAEKRPEWARERAGCSMLSCSS